MHNVPFPVAEKANNQKIQTIKGCPYMSGCSLPNEVMKGKRTLTSWSDSHTAPKMAINMFLVFIFQTIRWIMSISYCHHLSGRYLCCLGLVNFFGVWFILTKVYFGLLSVQSINQSNLLLRQYPRWSQAQWRKSQISVQQQNRGNSYITSTGHRACWYVWGKGQVKEMCLPMLLEGSSWIGWMDRQREDVPRRQGTRVKSSCICVGLDPRDWQIIIVVWSQWMGWKRCSKHGVKIDRLFFTQGLVGQQTALEQYSKPYWQPMKGTKQWNTASKWRWLCHQVGASRFWTRWSLVRSMSAMPYKSELQ